MRLVKKEFTANGSWVAPAGITNVILIGYGGGGGGGIGAKDSWAPNIQSGPGGGGSIQGMTTVTVVPNTSYTVTIGAGGAGATSVLPGNGADTTFGSLATFCGASGSYDFENINSYAGPCSRNSSGPVAVAGFYTASASVFCTYGPAYGGTGTGYADAAFAAVACTNPLGYAGGAQGTSGPGTTKGGGGGGGGPGGVGGAGSNGTTSGNSAAGGSPAANTGAGGGGSGSVTGGGNVAGNGGTGGSGKLTVIWIE